MSDQYNPQFEVSVERSGTTAIVRLAGELDLATAPELADVLQGLEPACKRIILDLTGLEFIDSTGLRLAVIEHDRAAADGFEFVIARSGWIRPEGPATDRPGRHAPAGARCRVDPRRRRQQRQVQRAPLTARAGSARSSARPLSRAGAVRQRAQQRAHAADLVRGPLAPRPAAAAQQPG